MTSARKPDGVRRGIAVAATAVLIAAAGLVVTTQDQGLTGTLEVAHADDFVTQPVRYHWLRKDDGQKVRLHFHDHGPMTGGQRVRIKGPRFAALSDGSGSGDVIDVQSLEVLPEPATAQAAVPEKRVAVLLINFANDTSQPVSHATANGVLLTQPDSVKSFFEEESRGGVTITGQVFGYYTIAASSTACDWGIWASQGRAAADAAGVNTTAYTNLVFVFPHTGACSWSGLGYLNGLYSFQNGGFDLRVVAHELGHNFGILHASGLSCTQAGVRVPLSSSCSFTEYGDPFTIMGTGITFHNNGLMVAQLGWMTPSEVQTVAGPGTYSVWPLLGSPVGTVKLLRVVRGDGTYLYLDYRVPFGTFDCFTICSSKPGGVMLRVSPDAPNPSLTDHNTMLVDATPATPTFADANLGSASVSDPVSGLTFTTSAAGASATITVSGGAGPTPAPTPVPTASPSVPPTASPSVTPTPSGSGGTTYLGVVGSASRSTSGNGSLTITASRSVTGTLVLAVQTSSKTGPVACSDSRGEPWTVDASASGTSRVALCSARNVSLAAGDTISVTYPPFSGVTLATVTNWQGNLTAYAVHTATGNSAVPNSGAVASAPGDLVIGVIAYTSTPTFAVGCGGALASEVAASSGSNRKALDVTWQVVTSPVPACGTLSFGRPWQSAAVAYR